MTKQMGCVCIAVCAGVLVLPSAARADNTTCANATWIVPDGSSIEGTFSAPGEARWFRFAGKENRSYAIMNEGPNPDNVVAGGIVVQAPCGTSIPTATNTTTFMEPASGSNATRLTITPAANTPFFFSTNGSTGQRYRIRVEDTTQVNTFFSTFSGFETFYRFANTTNEPVTYTLRMFNDLGVLVADATATIPGKRSGATRNTSPGDLDVPDNTAGFAVITHNGTPGALAADGFLSNGTAVLPLKIVNSRQSR